MKKIIVFGATGNLGVYFIDHLINNLDNSKYQIIATGRKKEFPYANFDVDYVSLDVKNKHDFDKLPKKDVYAVVDFAGVLPAYFLVDNKEYFETNTLGTLNILDYCIEANVDRMIYTQTWADLNGYLKEGKPLKPYAERKPIFTGDHAVYCISKCAAVDLMEYYHQEYGLKNFVFRLPNIYLYSPDKYYYVNGEKKLISYRYMINRAINGEDIECWGNPKKGKDIIYVKDLCGMIFNCLFVDKDHGVYNAGTGIKTSIEDQIKGFIEVFSNKEHPSKIIYRPEKNDCDDFVMDVSNIKEDLSYDIKYDYITYLKDYKKEMELNRFVKKEDNK